MKSLECAALASTVLCAAVVAPARAEPTAATRPGTSVVTVPADEAFESQRLEANPRGDASPTTVPANGLPGINAPAHSIGFDLGRMAIALAIVLGMIFGARWLFTHFFAGARAPATSSAVKVLSRTSLAPRQQILLLQVGPRVVVVGESNGQLSTLSQFDDPTEVAGLVGQLQEEQIKRAAAFGGLFGRAQRKMQAEDEHSAPMDTADVDAGIHTSNEESDARSELSGLLEKVRSIRNQIGR